MNKYFPALLLLFVLSSPVYPGVALPGGMEVAGSTFGATSTKTPMLYLLNHPPLTIRDLPEPDEGYVGHMIIQFSHPLGERERRLIAGNGGVIEAYIPDFAYLVYGRYSELMDLKVRDDVVGIATLPPTSKVSPELLNMDEREVPVLVLLHTHRISEPFSPRLTKVEDDMLVGALTPREALHVATMDSVSFIEVMRPYKPLNDVAAGIIGARPLWENLSVNGTHQLLTVCDTGLDTGNLTTLHLDLRSAVYRMVSWPIDPAWNYYVDNPGADDGPGDYSTGHGTHVSGSVLGRGNRSSGRFRGMAPEARLFFQAVEQWVDFNQSKVPYSDGYYLLGIPSNISRLFYQAYMNGSRIHTNSWGSNVWGAYTVSSMNADWFTWNYRNFTLLFAAGNSGPSANSIISPGSAKNVITVGASENYRPSRGSYGDNKDDVARFSSRGPTDDGRIKPDVIAPGTWVISTRSSVATGTGWGVYNQYYLYMGGTSMATPITAGATALLREYLQYRRNITSPSSSLLKGMLIASADDPASDPTPVPNNSEGWGRINLTKGLIDGRYRYLLLDHGEGLTTNSSTTFTFHLNNSDVPLKVILVWNDYPSSPSASKNLVNDLDLEVVLPNGTTLYGNDFTSPFNDTRDRTNNVEGIILNGTFPTGNYTVRVCGYNVPYSPQPFSVVVLGNVSGTLGQIHTSTRYYPTDGGVVDVEVFDPDMAGTGSVAIGVNSTSQPLPITLHLRESTLVPGLFRGNFTLKNSSGGSGDLLVSHMDRVFILYRDRDYSVDVRYTVWAVEPPKVLFFNHSARGTILSLWNIWYVVVRTRVGINATLRLDGSPWGTLNLSDDGIPPDRVVNDGNYTGQLLVDREASGDFNITVTLYDGYLPPYTYQLNEKLRVNTSLPRPPENLSAWPDPVGNTVHLAWNPSNETDLAFYRVYINASTPGNFTLWGNTSGVVQNYTVYPLVDGVLYFFYITAVDVNGNESGPSNVVSATPSDTVGPNVWFISPPNGSTVGRTVSIHLAGDDDCQRVQILFYRDRDGNGLPDDGENWSVIYSGVFSENVSVNTLAEGLGGGGGESVLFMVRGWDEVNNSGPNSTTLSLFVDTTPPLNTYVAGLPAYTNQSVMVVTAVGERGGWINVYMWEGNNRTLLYNLSLTSSDAIPFVLHLREGLNIVQLEAYDHLGNGPTVSKNATVVLDTSPPVIVLRMRGTVNVTDNVSISAEGSYDVGGVNNTGTGISRVIWYCPEEGLRITGFLFEHRFSSPGWYNITVTLEDLALNVNITTVRIRVVDNIPPRPMCQGDIVINEKVLFTLSAEGTTDNVPGIFQFGNFTWVISSPYAQYTYYGPTVITAIDVPGNYTGVLYVRDAEGNVANTSFSVLIKDITPPVVEIISPGEVRATHAFTLYANATDNDPAFPEGATFQWEIAELKMNHTGGRWTLTLSRAGLYTVHLTVVDRFKNSAESQALLRCLGDGTPPRVVSTSPAEGEINVSPRASITVEFSEPVYLPSLKGSIELLSESGKINFTYVLIQRTLRIYPSEPLPQGETVVLTLSSSINDESGEPLERNFSLTFHVAPPLKVLEIIPRDGEINVSVSVVIRVVFSAPINNTTLNWVKLISPTGREVDVDRRWCPENNTLMLSPLQPLIEKSVYTVVVGEKVEDIYGGSLGESVRATFITGVHTSPGGGENRGGKVRESGIMIIYLLLLALLVILLFLVVYVRNKRRGQIVLEEAGKSPFGRKAKVELTDEEKEMARKKFEGQPPRPLEGDMATGGDVESEIESPPEEVDEGWEEKPVEEPLFREEGEEGGDGSGEEVWPREVVVWEDEDEEKEEILWDLDEDLVKWEED